MCVLYYRDYLLKNNLLTEAEVDGISSYSELTEKLINAGFQDKIEEMDESVKNEMGLTDKQFEAVKSADFDEIISALVYHDASADIERNMKSYQLDNQLSDEEMEELRSKVDIVSLFPNYIIDDPKYFNRLVKIILDYITGYISPKTLIKPVNAIREYEFEYMSCQRIKGGQMFFVGFCGRGDNLLAIANVFSRKEYRQMNDDAGNAVCEFINCVNGLFASELSYEDLDVDLLVPDFLNNQKIIADDSMNLIPLVINNLEIDMIISQNVDIEII